MQKVTMTHVAKAAGVHQGTVSRALRNDQRLPLKTRQHIQKIAEEMGYRPNPLVSALIAERKKGTPSSYGSTIAFLTSGSTRTEWQTRSPQYIIMRQKIHDHALQRGYVLEDFWLKEPKMTPQRLKQILLYRGIRGIVVCPLQGNLSELEFDFSEFASVAIGYTLRKPTLNLVAIDYYTMMRQIVWRLLKNPTFERIGFITPSSISNRVQHISLGAFLAEHFRYPERTLSPLILHPVEDTEAFLQWVKDKRPDVIICPTQDVSTHTIRRLKEAAIAIPQQISVICADCHPNTTESGIIQDLDAEASAVVELLCSRIERGIFGVPSQPQSILVRGTWREGDSLRAFTPPTATEPSTTAPAQ